MSKRRGFTLTEIVVGIALTSLVLAMVGGCLYFVSTYSGTLINKSEELTKLQTIETHLRSVIGKTDNKIDVANTPNRYCITDADDKKTNIQWNESTNTLKIGTAEYKNITEFSLATNKGITQGDAKYFLSCTISYNNGDPYTFILGITQQTLPQ